MPNWPDYTSRGQPACSPRSNKGIGLYFQSLLFLINVPVCNQIHTGVLNNSSHKLKPASQSWRSRLVVALYICVNRVWPPDWTTWWEKELRWREKLFRDHCTAQEKEYSQEARQLLDNVKVPGTTNNFHRKKWGQRDTVTGRVWLGWSPITCSKAVSGAGPRKQDFSKLYTPWKANSQQ